MAKSKSQLLDVCLFSLMLVIDMSLMTSICFTVSIFAPSPTWVASKHTQISLGVSDPTLTSVASVGFYRNWFEAVNSMSIRKNSYVLPFGRFMSGVCRWYFRFVTGEFPPTQWYGGFTLVFDPGIHDVTTLLKRFGLLRYQIRSKDINSGIDDFLMTLPVGYIQETEKNRFFLVMMHLNLQKQNLRIMDSQMPHTWVVGNDDVDHVVGSNTSQVGSLREVTMNLLLCSDLWSSRVIFRDLSKSGKAISSKNTVETTTMVILFVILLKRITESSSFRKTLVRTLWYHCVYISELFMDTSGLKLRFAKIKFSYKLLHANRNREKSNMKLDNNGSYGRLASKTTLRKASSISLLLYFS